MDTMLDVLRYFFYPIPGSKFAYYIPLLIFVGLCIAGTIAMKYYIRKQGSENKAFKRTFGHFSYPLLWIAFLLLLNLFGRYERFPLLGSRFVLYIALVWAVYVIGKMVYSALKIYPAEKGRFKETPVQKKYKIEKYARH